MRCLKVPYELDAYLIEPMRKFRVNQRRNPMDILTQKVSMGIGINEWNHMRIDLRDDEVVHVEELGNFLHWEVSLD